MLSANNGAARIRREILTRLARLQFEGLLEQRVHTIALEMIPRDSQALRCCVFHDREVIDMRVLASLGFGIENYDESLLLSQYARKALERDEPTPPFLTVLDDACNSCDRSRYLVTNACQACIARSCVMGCPKKCVEIVDDRARIDDERCVHCGLCQKNCPFHAIIRVPVPCEDACPVNAITKDENGKARIDHEKCILCGACMRECPFGAVMHKGQMVEVIKLLTGGRKAIALYAPAVSGQFGAEDGRLEEALARAGFYRSYPVALGADQTAEHEARELEGRMARGEIPMTTSCCPAYVQAATKRVPALAGKLSEARTPMRYAAEMAKRDVPDGATVFISPCIAKYQESHADPFVDRVLSVEELSAIFAARGIAVADCEPRARDKGPSAAGREFARAGGATEAIRSRLRDGTTLRPRLIDGLDREALKNLEALARGLPDGEGETPNLVEIMACKGGCVAGPLTIADPKVAAARIRKNAASGGEGDGGEKA
jgi:[FeFe] hydrogenase (group B1/B3)